MIPLPIKWRVNASHVCAREVEGRIWCRAGGMARGKVKIRARGQRAIMKMKRVTVTEGTMV